MTRTAIYKMSLAAIFGLVSGIAGYQFYEHRHYQAPIIAGPGVTRVVKLHEYCPSLKGTPADTDVFFLEGAGDGGTVLLVANTHSNEPAARLTAEIFLENCTIQKGRLIVIPQFNNSGSRNTKPGDGYPLYFEIPTAWGKKKFRMGNRNASPLDSWPDPDVYIHYPDRSLLSYLDVRNTNRTWPGRPDGPLMERVCFAAMELIRNEQVDVAIDIHGAETMFPVTNCIVAPEKSSRIATMVQLMTQAMEGFTVNVYPSPQNFRGLSHREIGDYSNAMPFLLEAPIPFLDQPTGPKTEELLLTGRDPLLLSLARQGKLFVPYDEYGWPMKNRVGQHCSVILEIMNQLSQASPERAVVAENVPRYKDVLEHDVGYYYHNPATADPARVYPN
ncbi:succinylglutamate desuccinylase/aspartoacylase family protein [bacterium]|nr:succinylglutamate desuccinylase/aspartoacylase family protein [bacterium]